MNTDWRGGFLFLGNRLSLDFLNTRPVIDGKPLEMLPDSIALERWLIAAGLCSKDGIFEQEAPTEMEALRSFRENLRRAVIQIEAGRRPEAEFLLEVNELLARHPVTSEIVVSGTDLERKQRFWPSTPSDAFGPILDDLADLLTSGERSKIRKCPTCVLHFYDTSKKGARRWCSMSMCGNRSKVAAYAQRKRSTSPAGLQRGIISP